jgi:hypothetical protein
LANDAEKKVEVAARRMLEEKERAQVSVSNVSESLSSFMTSLSGAVEKTSAEIETEMRGEKKEE